MDCIFCRIATGDIPAQIVYSDDNSIAFRDLNPQAPTHVLVIPRTHIVSLNDAATHDAAVIGSLLHTAARVAALEGLAENGYRTIINTGAGAGQTVFHLHLHIIGGRALTWPPG